MSLSSEGGDPKVGAIIGEAITTGVIRGALDEAAKTSLASLTATIQNTAFIPILQMSASENIIGHVAREVLDPYNGYVWRTEAVIAKPSLETEAIQLQDQLKAAHEKVSELDGKLVQTTRESKTWNEIAEDYARECEKLQRLLDRRFNGYGGWAKGGSLE